uniref:Putative LOC101895980 [Musca domestica] n=1 Tax=Lepeophtheirus salmonis TaxID=72036 RepID=A0A0K2TAN0_LEPSM
MRSQIFLITIFTIVSTGSCLRCFSCRSDDQVYCGDPFYAGNIPVEECANMHTFETYLCYKAQNYVGGQYMTIRGCAPFDSEIFDPNIQRDMAGSYWESYSSGKVLSFCDTDNCNGAESVTKTSVTFSIVTILITLFFV